jgi:universal stress protein E
MRRFKNLLLVLTNSDDQEAAMKRAIELAVTNQASLTVIDILPDTHLGISDLKMKGRRSDLEKLKEDFAADVPVAIDVLQGTLFLEIIRKVLKEGHDLVLKTAQKQNVIQRIFFSSADMHLLRKCPCPVWLLRPGGKEKYGRILVAVDIGSSEDDEKMEALNRQILEMASSVAFSQGVELHIVHAWHVEGTSMVNSYRFKSQKQEIQEWIDTQKQQLEKQQKGFNKLLKSILGDKEQEYLQLEVHMVEGYAEQVIPQLAKDIKADLVVMGTVVRTGLPGFLMGNTAEGILNHLDCSVLAIKPEGFVTPVTLA